MTPFTMWRITRAVLVHRHGSGEVYNPSVVSQSKCKTAHVWNSKGRNTYSNVLFKFVLRLGGTDQSERSYSNTTQFCDVVDQQTEAHCEM